MNTAYKQLGALGWILVGLLVARCHAQAATESKAGAREQATVGLDARDFNAPQMAPAGGQKPPAGMLVRELVRQAVLLAARDQLGLATRDETLRETMPPPGKPTAYPVALTAEIDVNRKLKLRLSGLSANGRPIKLQATPLALPDTNWLTVLVQQLEPLTRTQFAGFFGDLGYEGTPNRTISDAEIAEPVSRLLEKMDFISQFAAVRELHAVIRRDGESPQRLGALARGYVNLGSVTEFHWAPAHKAFTARALLYAERLVAREQGTSFALWNRAYVRALAGLHTAALSDLEAAATASKRGADPAPSWLAAIRAFCAYEPDKLAEAAAEPGNAQLVPYLALLTHEWSLDDQVLMNASSAMLAANGDCDRTVDRVSSLPQLSIKRATARKSLRWFAQRLYPRLQELPGLPAAARELVEQRALVEQRPMPAADEGGGDETPGDEATDGEPEDAGVEIAARIKLLHTLHEAGEASDRGAEPSWQVLEHLIRDVSFVLVWRVLDLDANILGVNTSRTSERWQPLVQGSPYELFIHSFAGDTKRRLATMRKLLQAVHGGQHELTELPVDKKLGQLLGASLEASSLSQLALRNQDPVFRDLVRTAQSAPNSFEGRVAPQMLLEISPHHPATVVSLAAGNWTYAAKHAAEWEERYRDLVDVQRSLGQLYVNLDRLDDARRVLERGAAASPGFAVYRQLAAVQKQQADYAAWQHSLEQALELPVLGLEHAQVLVELADHFMETLEWDRALPYAYTASRSQAQWAQECAGRCYEGMQNWERSEPYFRSSAKRYAASSLNWFLWCARTGHGSKVEARQLAEDYLTPRLESSAGEGLAKLQMAILHALNGDSEQALKLFQEHWKQHSDFASGYYVISLADELGQHERRDEIVKFLATGNQETEFNTGRWRFRLALLFSLVLERKDAGAWNSRRFEELLVDCDNGDATDLYYFAGRFLGLRGEQDLSRKYLQMAASSPYRQRWACALANVVLQNDGMAAFLTRGFELDDRRMPLARAVRQGNFERARGLHDRAIRAYAKALDIEHGFRPALVGRARSQFLAGKFDDSLADCDALLKESPDDPAIQKLRQEVLASKQRAPK